LVTGRTGAQVASDLAAGHDKTDAVRPGPAQRVQLRDIED
jgi:hypothetical protein